MSDFKVGEEVMAKWSGSKRYFKGKVVKTGGSSVNVVFEDGTTSTLKIGEVQKLKETAGRSTSRSRSKPRSPQKAPKARSRSRSVSVGRQSGAERSRSKSKTKTPTQTPSSPKKSPKKKSPSRSATSKSPARKATSKSPARKATSKSPAREASSKSPKRAALKSPSRSPARTKRQTTPSSSPKKSAVKKRESSLSPGKKSPKARTRGRPSKTAITLSTSSISTIGLKELTIQANKYEPKKDSSKSQVQKGLQPTNLKEKIALLEEEQKQQSEKIFVARLRSARQSILQQETRSIQSVDELDQVLSIKPSAPASKRDISFIRSLGSLVILFAMPLQVLFLILACARNQGKLFAMPYISKNWRFYITPIPTAAFFGFVLLQGLLQILPIGPIVEGFVQASKVPKKNLTYRKNGLIALVITLSLIPVAIYFDKLPTEFIRAHLLHLASADIVFCLILSVALYVKSFYAPPHDVNPSGDTKYFYHNFVVGRQLNPRIGINLDLKFLLFRIGLIAWALIVVLLLYKVYAVNHSIHCTLAMTGAMQLLYIVDLLWREEQILATPAMLYDGVGFYNVFQISALIPFTATLPVLYLVDRKTEMPYYCLTGIVVLYLIGFYISRKSNTVKYSVMKNPHAQENQNIETISSNKGDLVCSGLWGLVRHPNYLGDILLFLSWSLPCEFAAGVPYVPFASAILIYILRTFEVEKHMEERYGRAFSQYKKRVPKRLVPYVF